VIVQIAQDSVLEQIHSLPLGPLRVRSRLVVDAPPEQLRPVALPVLEGVDGSSAFQEGLRERAVVEVDVAQEGLGKVLAALEAMALQDVVDPAVEPLDHSVGLWPHRWREAVLGAEVCAELVELMLSGADTLAHAEQAVG
jgi:hypothetical protein